MIKLKIRRTLFQTIKWQHVYIPYTTKHPVSPVSYQMEHKVYIILLEGSCMYNLNLCYIKSLTISQVIKLMIKLILQEPGHEGVLTVHFSIQNINRNSQVLGSI